MGFHGGAYVNSFNNWMSQSLLKAIRRGIDWASGCDFALWQLAHVVEDSIWKTGVSFQPVLDV